MVLGVKSTKFFDQISQDFEGAVLGASGGVSSTNRARVAR
jgi:hypothetical protein